MQTGCQNMFEELLPIQLTYSYCSIHIRALYIIFSLPLIWHANLLLFLYCLCMALAASVWRWKGAQQIPLVIIKHAHQFISPCSVGRHSVSTCPMGLAFIFFYWLILCWNQYYIYIWFYPVCYVSIFRVSILMSVICVCVCLHTLCKSTERTRLVLLGLVHPKECVTLWYS